MTSFRRSVLRGGWLALCVLLATTGLAYAQATSTFNGRVLDQGDAVLPGVTITATNVSTGVARTGFVPSIGYARQVQLGARFLF
jgi:hypothetical protein